MYMYLHTLCYHVHVLVHANTTCALLYMTTCIQPSGKVSICVPLFMELHSVPVKFNLQIEPLIVHQLHNLAEREGERGREREGERERERERERETEGERERERGRERKRERERERERDRGRKREREREGEKKRQRECSTHSTPLNTWSREAL